MKETVISWSIMNWITVFLMVSIGMLVAGTATKIFSKSYAGKENSDNA